MTFLKQNSRLAQGPNMLANQEMVLERHRMALEDQAKHHPAAATDFTPLRMQRGTQLVAIALIGLLLFWLAWIFML